MKPMSLVILAVSLLGNVRLLAADVIKGFAYHENSTVGFPGVDVTLFDGNKQVPPVTPTGQDGSYEFPVKAGTTYRLEYKCGAFGILATPTTIPAKHGLNAALPIYVIKDPAKVQVKDVLEILHKRSTQANDPTLINADLTALKTVLPAPVLAAVASSIDTATGDLPKIDDPDLQRRIDAGGVVMVSGNRLISTDAKGTPFVTSILGKLDFMKALPSNKKVSIITFRPYDKMSASLPTAFAAKEMGYENVVVYSGERTVGENGKVSQ